MFSNIFNLLVIDRISAAYFPKRNESAVKTFSEYVQLRAMRALPASSIFFRAMRGNAHSHTTCRGGGLLYTLKLLLTLISVTGPPLSTNPGSATATYLLFSCWDSRVRPRPPSLHCRVSQQPDSARHSHCTAAPSPPDRANFFLEPLST